MLVLSRKEKESIIIRTDEKDHSKDIRIKIIKIRLNSIHIGIEAPVEFSISRPQPEEDQR